MLGVLAKYFDDVSVLRRLLFAVVFLNPELPMFCGVVVEFATAGKVTKASVSADQAKVIVENLQVLNSTPFVTDHSLQQELISLSIPGKNPLGYILISHSDTCVSCGSKLQIRKDRHAPVTIYDSKLGTIPGAHFHKLCSRRNCNVTQHYGYYTTKGGAVANSDWESYPYFASSRDTFFSVDLLKQIDAYVLIGQLSFKQQAEIYNYMHKYLGSSTVRYVYGCACVHFTSWPAILHVSELND